MPFGHFTPRLPATTLAPMDHDDELDLAGEIVGDEIGKPVLPGNPAQGIAEMEGLIERLKTELAHSPLPVESPEREALREEIRQYVLRLADYKRLQDERN